jgi:hypothetical protein
LRSDREELRESEPLSPLPGRFCRGEFEIDVFWHEFGQKTRQNAIAKSFKLKDFAMVAKLTQ